MPSEKSQRIFLDNNATTPRDPRVLDIFLDTERKFFGNSLSNHVYGWEAEEVVNIARENIAKLFEAEPEAIIFTSGATEANCLAILGFDENLSTTKKDIKFVTSKIEHRAVLASFLKLSKNGRSVLSFENDEIGRIKHTLDEKFVNPDFISLQLANNEIGTIQDVQCLSEIYPNSFIHTDAAQAAGKIDVNIKDLAVDCMTISAHKMHGPVGIGALIFNNKASFKKVAPQIIGGTQQNEMRAGTIPVSLIAAFGEAARIAKIEINENKRRLVLLGELFLRMLKIHAINFTLIGEEDLNLRLPGNLSLRILGMNSSKLISKLGTKIAFSTGSACLSHGNVSHVLSAINLSEDSAAEVIRIGIGKQNTEDEIEFTVSEIAKCLNKN